MKRNLSVVLFLAIVLLFGSSSGAWAFTLSWSPVTTYTDNTTIGSEAGGVFYNVEMDGLTVTTKTTAIKWTLPLVIRKSIHSFRAQCEVGTGEKSVWSPVYTWTAPAYNPFAPGHLNVAQLVVLPEDYRLQFGWKLAEKKFKGLK